MDILAKEDLEHLETLEFTRVTDQQSVEIRKLTKQDSLLPFLKMMILAGWLDTKDEAPLCIKEYWSYRDELIVYNGVIVRGNCVIIPKVLRPHMVTRIHASHLGAETCLRKARDAIYWPKINSEVKDFISNCTAMLTCKTAAKNHWLVILFPSNLGGEWQ